MNSEVKRLKNWVTPEFIILIRNNPEELVLGYCKGGYSSGENNSYVSCYTGCDNITKCNEVNKS